MPKGSVSDNNLENMCKCDSVSCIKCYDFNPEFYTNDMPAPLMNYKSDNRNRIKPHIGQVKTEDENHSIAIDELSVKLDYDHPNFLLEKHLNREQGTQRLPRLRTDWEALNKQHSTFSISSRRHNDSIGTTHAQELSLRCLVCSWSAINPQELIMHIYTHIDDIQYICLICYTVHRTKAVLQHHISSEHRLYTCDGCCKHFATLAAMKVHNLTHSSRKHRRKRPKQQMYIKGRFDCTICHKQYRHRSGLRYHMRTFHSGKRNECTICNREFRAVKFYHKHMHLKHNVLDAGVCNKCFKDISQENELNTHDCVPEKEKQGPFQCDICHKLYPAKKNLNEHMRLHTGKNSHECSICFRRFTQLSHVTVHERTHSNERPFECDICHKRYNQQGSLTMHKRVHTGERPHKCDICSKAFIRPAQLVLHKLSHTDERKFECNVCHKRFKQSCALTVHMDIHTGQRYKCDICHKEFAQKAYLVAHQRKHNNNEAFMCEICSKRFTVKGHFNDHMRTHTQHRPFQCETCERRFTQKAALDKHKLLHTGQRPHKCDVCHKEFYIIYNLIKHKVIHTRPKPSRGRGGARGARGAIRTRRRV